MEVIQTVIPAPTGLGQKDYEFQVSFSFITKPHLKRPNN